MGASTFSQIEWEPDLRTAFAQARDKAGTESGYSYSGTISQKDHTVAVSNRPVVPEEAHQIADRLIDTERFSDKWESPAGAVPLLSPTRDVEAKLRGSWVRSDANLVKLVTAEMRKKKLLRAGEKVEAVVPVSYQRAHVNRQVFGFQTDSADMMVDPTFRVTVRKANMPVVAERDVEVKIPAGLDYDVKNKEIRKAVAATLRLKKGERIAAVSSDRETEGKATVKAEATKGATKTRYVVAGQRSGHTTWDTGFDTQAQARAYAVKCAEAPQGWGVKAAVDYEVAAITRRVDGQPLVRVTRHVGQVTAHVKAITVTGSTDGMTPDGWLFFGWASS